MKKQAKFFCENCGSEVPQNARYCKMCGKFFTSVRCPNCGYVGIATAFTAGCPQCGYADPGMGIGSAKEKSSATTGKNNNYSTNRSSKKRTGDSPLPIWIYFLTFGVLLVVIAAVLHFVG